MLIVDLVSQTRMVSQFKNNNHALKYESLRLKILALRTQNKTGRLFLQSVGKKGTMVSLITSNKNKEEHKMNASSKINTVFSV